MPHVSKQKVEGKVFESLYKELESLIIKSDSKNARLVLNDLLTKTEKIMLAKRLVAGLMFSQGCSQYQVWTTLKISSSTAARMSLAYERGDYNNILTVLKEKQIQSIWPLIEKISRGGLPPMGKGRWSFVLKNIGE